MSEIKFPVEGCSGYRKDGKEKCIMYMRCMRTKINSVSKSIGNECFDEAPFIGRDDKTFECNKIVTDIHKIWNMPESEVSKLYKEYFNIIDIKQPEKKEDIIIEKIDESKFFSYEISNKLKCYNDEETGYGYYKVDGTHTTSQTYFDVCRKENKDKRLCIALKIDMFPDFFEKINTDRSNESVNEMIKAYYEDMRKYDVVSFSYILDKNLVQTAIMCKVSEKELISFISSCYEKKIDGLLPIKMYLQYIDGCNTLADDVELIYSWSKKAFDKHSLIANNTAPPKIKTNEKKIKTEDKSSSIREESKKDDEPRSNIQDENVVFFELDFYFDSEGNKIKKIEKIEVLQNNSEINLENEVHQSNEQQKQNEYIDSELLDKENVSTEEIGDENEIEVENNTVTTDNSEDMFKETKSVEDAVSEIKEHKQDNQDIRNISEIQKENNSPQINTNRIITSAFDEEKETNYVEYFPLQQKIDMDFEIAPNISNDALSRNNTAKGIEEKKNPKKKQMIKNQPSLFDFTPERRIVENNNNSIIDEIKEDGEKSSELKQLFQKEKRIKDE